MSKNVTRLFAPIRKLLGRPDQARDLSRSVLLLQLENTELLSRNLDKAAMSHLLVQLSMTLGRAVRPYDPVRVLSPGLFAFVLRNRTDRDAMQVAHRLHRKGQTPISIAGQTLTPVISGALVHADGTCLSGPNLARDHLPEPDLPTIETLIDNARHRLQATPDNDLGRLRLYPYDTTLTGAPLVATISDAISADQVEAWFQPQVCCHSGAITGFEALARWNHPVRGILAPGVFMPQMSEADHTALTQAMLTQSLMALKEWDKSGFSVPTVSVNISNNELSERGFADCLLWELDRHEIRPDRLVIEVLESVGPVTSNADVRVNLRKLSKAGCHIDLDDFGTGYASLDAIRQFGIHRIKLDRSFVTGCDIDPAQQRMILAILALAERLGIAALGEGVETREEHAFLAQMGCDEVQGYAIARPMPLSASMDFLRRHNAAAADLPSIARRS
ncbi:EAL domain-containing protein [Paracoccus sp. R86501]|uniref:EAL domain-containing protein n=1 Tax=Paracoccus sp. R86501 TaxID=3101711 RepID=UPI003670C72F